MKARSLVLYIGLLFILVQCNRTNKGNITNASPKVDSTQQTTKKDITYLLLSPNEVLNEIFSKKANLNPQFVNPQNNAVKYLDTRSQSLNLGVYIADFAYLNLTENKTNALNYFKIIRDLAQKNNIYGCFDEEIFSRIQNNLANNDSIIHISQEMYYNMSDHLENANRSNIFALISSGALVEALYLSTMNIGKYSDYQLFAQKIFDQEQLFDSFYSFILFYKKDKDVESILMQLKDLKKILDGSQTKTTKLKVIKGKNNHLEVQGGGNVVVTEKSFDEFKDYIIKIREHIISIQPSK